MPDTEQGQERRWTLHICPEHRFVNAPETNEDGEFICPDCGLWLDEIDVVPADHQRVLEDKYERMTKAANDACEERDEARDEKRVLVEALRRAEQPHTDRCSSVNDPPHPCDCGLDAALEAAGEHDG